jgi:hypothetical protein
MQDRWFGSEIDFFFMRRFLPLLAAIALLVGPVNAQGPSESAWTKAELSFRPIAITSNGMTFWACGTDGSIASSSNGHDWQIKSRVDGKGALLLGIEFASNSFGYAYGTGGTLLTTTDGGVTWNARKVGAENILLASFSDSTHGLIRTSSSLLYLAGGDPQPVPLPFDVPSDFKFAPSLAALSADKMAAVVSEGWRSRAGFVSTVDGGKTWKFFEPPEVITYDFLRVGDEYRAIGTETVDFDKPGGGYGVPAVLSSSDAQVWSHVSGDIRPCHWEGCHVCKPAGCLASRTLLIHPYGPQSSFASIPPGHLGAAWTATSRQICSIDGSIYCADLGLPKDTVSAGEPQPDEPQLPPLGTKPATGLVRCVSCSLVRLLVDPKLQGDFTVHFTLTVRPDGTPESVVIKDAPSDAIRAKLQEQMISWLFEPPMKDDTPVAVHLNQSVAIHVFRPR